MSDTATNKTGEIRRLNDQLRRTFAGGKVLLTKGVDRLPRRVKLAALLKVENFNDFTDGDDPYHEHDFGAFEVNGCKFFWKVDYYDRAMKFGSEDPSDPAK